MCGIIGYKGNRNTTENKTISHSQKFKDIPKSEIMNILNFIKFENYYCQINPLFQKNLRDKISNYSNIARKVNVSSTTISRILNIKEYWINFRTLLNIVKLFNINKKKVYQNIKYIKTHNSFPLSFSIKNLISPSFFRILGHILGDGGIHIIEKEKKYRAFYSNNQKPLLDSFTRDIKRVFGNIKLYTRERRWQGDEIWLPTTVGCMLYHILNYKKNKKKKRIPHFVFNTKDKKLLGVFLQALYDDDGYLYTKKNMIVIAQKSKNLIQDIRKVVSNIGIRPNKILIHKSKSRTKMYYFSITHKDNFRIFNKVVGFQHPIKKRKLGTLMSKYGGK